MFSTELQVLFLPASSHLWMPQWWSAWMSTVICSLKNQHSTRTRRTFSSASPEYLRVQLYFSQSWCYTESMEIKASSQTRFSGQNLSLHSCPTQTSVWFTSLTVWEWLSEKHFTKCSQTSGKACRIPLNLQQLNVLATWGQQKRNMPSKRHLFVFSWYCEPVCLSTVHIHSLF